MVDGYFFINGNSEFILIGVGLTPKGRKVIAEVYDYQDGQRLLAILAMNQHKWKLANL